MAISLDKPGAKKLALIIPFVVTFFAYVFSLNGEIFFDDVVILKNWVVTDFSIKGIFTFSPKRFVTYFFYALEYKIFSGSPFGIRLVSLVLHLLNGFLIYIFVKKLVSALKTSGKAVLLPDDTVFFAFISSCIFLLHPVQGFTIVYLAQQQAILVLFFSLLTLVVFIELKKGFSCKKLALLIAVLIMGCLTKENFFMIFPVLIVLEIVISGFNKRIGLVILAIAILFLGFVALLIIRPELYKAFDLFTRETDYYSRQDYFLAQLHIITFYISKFIFPIRLAFEYAFEPIRNFSDTRAIAGAIIHSFAIILGFIGVFSKYRLPSFGVLFFYLMLAVESSFIPIRDIFFFHRIYTPMSGLIILFAFFVSILADKNKLLKKVLPVLIILFFGGYSAYNASKMQTQNSIYTNILDISPAHLRAIVFKTRSMSLKDPKAAEKYIKKMYLEHARNQPINKDFVTTYASILMMNRKSKLAGEFLKSIMDANVNLHDKLAAHYGISLFNIGKYSEAARWLRFSIKNSRVYSDYEKQLASYYFSIVGLEKIQDGFQEDKVFIRESLDYLLASNFNPPMVLYLDAKWHFLSKDMDKALGSVRKSLGLDPSSRVAVELHNEILSEMQLIR